MHLFKELTLACLGLSATLIPAVTAGNLTKEDADVGRVNGFTHNNASSHAGDYLVSTFCYCGYGMDLNDTEYDESHYFQFDYYNSHLNTTFIAQHFCFKAIDDKHTCFNPRAEDGSLDLSWEFDWSGGVCKTWPRAHFKHGNENYVDEFCYIPHYATKNNQLEDYIMFNGQKRDVGQFGGQGYRKTEDFLAKGKCESLCDMHTDMPLVEGNALAVSRIVVNDHVDDMCDKCK